MKQKFLNKDKKISVLMDLNQSLNYFINESSCFLSPGPSFLRHRIF